MAPRRPPDVCPRCGAVGTYRPRYTTGGGWRIDTYQCRQCGHRFDHRREKER